MSTSDTEKRISEGLALIEESQTVFLDGLRKITETLNGTTTKAAKPPSKPKKPKKDKKEAPASEEPDHGITIEELRKMLQSDVDRADAKKLIREFTPKDGNPILSNVPVEDYTKFKKAIEEAAE